ARRAGGAGEDRVEVLIPTEQVALVEGKGRARHGEFQIDEFAFRIAIRHLAGTEGSEGAALPRGIERPFRGVDSSADGIELDIRDSHLCVSFSKPLIAIKLPATNCCSWCSCRPRPEGERWRP